MPNADDSARARTIRLNPEDNVVVAPLELEPGALLAQEKVSCLDRIPAGHKVAAAEIPAGEPIRKYGQIIGFASETIQPGRHVHTHNVVLKEFSRDYAVGTESRPTKLLPPEERATFMGYLREDGRVGTRNYIGVLPTVNCSAGAGRFIAEAFDHRLLADYPNLDGVVNLSHGTGCGMAGYGESFQALQRVLDGYARHPNFGGVLLVGLGCEVNQVDRLLEDFSLAPGFGLKTLNIQDLGGTRETVAKGVAAVKEMLPRVNDLERRPVPVSELVVGLECGGSDAYSGISANPALGAAADLLVRHGGTAVLSETTEIYGAEHLLTRRAAKPEVAAKLIDLIHWWEEYTARLGAEINNNPSPGNKAGGLTTILEKSLGAAAKGGTTDLIQVYRYAEPVTAKGFVFMDTPGYDVASVTGMVAGGAQLVCFTTGRGTVCGFLPSPTIKLATNSAMYNRLKEDMDLNCGRVVDGEVDILEMGRIIFDLIIETASGRPTKSEALGYGRDEFVPWQFGAVL